MKAVVSLQLCHHFSNIYITDADGAVQLVFIFKAQKFIYLILRKSLEVFGGSDEHRMHENNVNHPFQITIFMIFTLNVQL